MTSAETEGAGLFGWVMMEKVAKSVCEGCNRSGPIAGEEHGHVLRQGYAMMR